MDPSALIFVALAVAWAVYLIPKALQHHDDAVRSRSVDRFSHTMRVLARREPVSRRNARLVVTPGRPASAAVVVTKGADPSPAVLRARREAANAAARRRRRVLGTILLANLVMVALASAGVVAWPYVGIPAGLLVAWLVACRVMVRSERAAWTTPVRRIPVEMPTEEVDEDATGELAAVHAPGLEVAAVVDTSAIAAAMTDPTLWDPVPVTLPTYVTKPTATRRTVRTIDLDDTGVWTSGRTDADSAIAREADSAARASRKQAGDDQRAVGS